MASGGGNDSTKQKTKEEKDRDHGATTTALAVGASLAVGAAAAWGISKWLGSSDPEPPHKEMTMEALGSSEIAWLGNSDPEPSHNDSAWLGSSDPQLAPKETAHRRKTTAIDIIDHELPYDTHNTYDVVFFGDSVHTTVACDPAVVSDWISEVESLHRRSLDNLIVGLDVEWRPSFSRIENPAATLQICVGRKCLIFQLIHSPSVPPSLVNFLENPSYTFVGIGINQDLEKLGEDYGFGFHTKTVDLRDLAAAEYGRKELKNAGLKTLASVVLEKEVEKPKSVTMSRWDNQWLTPNQVRYACVDAFVCSEIGRILNASSATPR